MDLSNFERKSRKPTSYRREQLEKERRDRLYAESIRMLKTEERKVCPVCGSEKNIFTCGLCRDCALIGREDD